MVGCLSGRSGAVLRGVLVLVVVGGGVLANQPAPTTPLTPSQPVVLGGLVFKRIATEVCPIMSTLAIYTVPTMMGCSMMCQHNRQCNGICYSQGLGQCLLYDENGEKAMASTAGGGKPGYNLYWLDIHQTFTRRGKKAYRIFKISLNDVDATASCNNLQAHLIVPENREELDDLATLPGIDGIGNIRIGINDKAKEGEWRVVHTGELATYTPWSEGAPDNQDLKYGLLGAADCGEYEYYIRHEGWLYDDIPCNDPTEYICELVLYK